MKILVVEDQRRLADNIVKGLKQEKYQAEPAYDGITAFQKIKEGTWHLILLDWMLPGKDGPTILQEMRECGIDTPVIFLTTKGETYDKIEMLQSGADDYLTKPFDFEELLARITAQLRRPQAFAGKSLSVGDLVLNTTTKEVKRGETPITLSSTEFRLLEFLMISPHQVMNETQLLDNVWDYADISFSNKVSVYIRYLRNKIDRPFPEKPSLIQTVRGLGYKISDN